ncbi:MAG TPA: ornithine cyclodeaminase family protein [Bryobacteraceae bacterium]|nr:ornithine cyclodeaminase family protein [Bryobacteraceae bacterium]
MFYFTEADVRELLPMSEAVRLMRMAFEALAIGRAKNQPRRRLILESTGSVLHSMAGACGNYFGTKFYSTNPRYGAHFHFILYDAKTATPLALIEANHLGQIRTGAASGYATDLLANPEAKTLAIIGSGFQAKTQLEAMRAVRPIETVRVWSRSEEKREKFAADHSVVATATAEEAVRGADIVVTATNAKDPVVEKDWIAPGALVNAMGSNVANRRELPSDLVRDAGLVAVDSLEQAKIEAGELILAESWDNVVELQNVKRHYDPGQITIFKSIGLGVEDVAAGAFLYERALATPERFADRNRATR